MATTISRLLTRRERELARPPERISVSEWCDRNRVLDPLNSSRPGPWRTDFAPYLREILDSTSDGEVREVVLMCSTQVGKTEALINTVLRTVAADPRPLLYVLPTEELVKSFSTRRLKVAIEACDETRRRRTGNRKADWKSNELGFDSMTLYLAWANSPAGLSSRAIGGLLMDEIDKFPLFAGRAADPISLARERLRTFPDSLLFAASTPTLADGYVNRMFLDTDRRRFFVPCPFCGRFQALEFARNRVVWPKDVRDPDRIAGERLASYRCESCDRLIGDDDDHKRRMLAGGRWKPEDAEILADGSLRNVPRSSRRGFQLSALYSPWLSWSEVAAEFLRSKDEVSRVMNFTNSWLGLPWVERSTSITAEDLQARVDTNVELRTVPRGAVVLVAGVDVQKDALYYVVRACGRSERSCTIDAGRVDSFEILRNVLSMRYAFVDAEKPEDSLPIRLACIDSGYRTDEVYEFALELAHCVRPTKGHESRTAPISATIVERDIIGRAFGLQLWHLDVGYFKDKFARHATADLGAAGSWRPWSDPPEEFLAHLTSEHKVLIRSKTRADVRTVWRPKSGGVPNHWWDCEIYATAALDMLGAYALHDDDPPAGGAAARPPKPKPGSPGGERKLDFRAGAKKRGGGRWIRRNR